MSRERLSPRQWARLEAELRRGPLAHGFAQDQRWTLGRIKTLIGKLFHLGYTVEGFEDEAGQGLKPPRARRGARPVVRVRGGGGGRVSIAGVACYRPGDRPHLFYQLRVYRRRKGEAKGFTWQDYRDLIIAAHHNLSAPLIWVWDNLNIHLAPELADFATENKAWLRVYRLPAYAPDLNPAEGIWSLLKRSIANFAAADLDSLVRIIKRKLKKIQYRPHLIDGCLAATGLTIEPW